MLEGSRYLPPKHQTMLRQPARPAARSSVDDVMTPRREIDALDLELPVDELRASSWRPASIPACPCAAARPTTSSACCSSGSCCTTGTTPTGTSKSSCVPLLRPPYFVPVGHAAPDPAPAFPGEPAAAGAGRRRVRRTARAGRVRGHPRGDRRRVHHQRARAATSSSGETDGSVIVDGSTLLRTLNRRLGHQAADRRAPDAERPDPRALRRHPRSRRQHPRRRAGAGDPAHPGSGGQNGPGVANVAKPARSGRRMTLYAVSSALQTGCAAAHYRNVIFRGQRTEDRRQTGRTGVDVAMNHLQNSTES